jgi:hypothetical protein
VLLMLGWIHAIQEALLPIGREIRVQLHHGALRRLRIRSIHLNLIIALRTKNGREKIEAAKKQRRSNTKAQSKRQQGFIPEGNQT